MQTQLELEAVRSEMEKVMVGLPSDKTDGERRMFLAGYIECLSNRGQINEDNRETLYGEYCF